MIGGVARGESSKIKYRSKTYLSSRCAYIISLEAGYSRRSAIGFRFEEKLLLAFGFFANFSTQLFRTALEMKVSFR